MGSLQRLSSGEALPLTAQCLVGRGAACSLVLDDRFASSEHAKILWTGSGWRIRDLGSRNGTFVDGRRLDPGKLERLEEGARVGFGGEEEGYSLFDASPPSAMATDVDTKEVKTAEGDILALPSEDTPVASVYRSKDAGWVTERPNGELEPVHDQSVISVAGRSYRLDLPVHAEATPMIDVAIDFENAQLRFYVSSDEERVETEVVLRGEVFSRLESREHSYLLLTLARARLEDTDKPPRERGWLEVEQILRMLRVDQNSLNVAIHRARQQLAATGLEGAASVVETKRGYRRLGTDRVSVDRLVEG